jgi:tetratricopeptide (TPR) repeat protein
MKNNTENTQEKKCQNPECHSLLEIDSSSFYEPFICQHCGFPNFFEVERSLETQNNEENLFELLKMVSSLIEPWKFLPLYKIKREMITDEIMSNIKKIADLLQKTPIDKRKQFKDSDLWLALGDICFRVHDLISALLFYSQIVMVEPSKAETYCRLGEVAIEREDFASADLYFNRALAIDLNSTEALNGIASLELIYKQYNNALEKFLDVLKRDPNNLDALFGAALVSYTLQAYSSTDFYIKKILEIDPEYPAAYNLLGMRAHNNKYYAVAESHYKKSLEFDDHSWVTWNNLAALYIDMRNFGQARAYLQKAAALAPNQAKIWVNYGYLEYELMNYQEAENYFKKAIELDSKEVTAWRALATIYHIVKKQYPEAERCYNRIMELTPNDQTVWQNYGNLLTLMGRSTEANEAYEKAGTAKTGCFIATAAFGTPISAELDTLRSYRDTVLKTHWMGRAFIFIYYRISPPIANIIRNYEGMKSCVRVVLMKLITKIKKLKNKDRHHEP